MRFGVIIRKPLFTLCVLAMSAGASASVDALGLSKFSNEGPSSLFVQPNKASICADLVQEKHLDHPSHNAGMSRRQAGVATLGMAFGARYATSSPYPRYHEQRAISHPTNFTSVSNPDGDRSATKKKAWSDFKRCINA